MEGIESVRSDGITDPFQSAFVRVELSPVSGCGHSDSAVEIGRVADATE